MEEDWEGAWLAEWKGFTGRGLWAVPGVRVIYIVDEGGRIPVSMETTLGRVTDAEYVAFPPAPSPPTRASGPRPPSDARHALPGFPGALGSRVVPLISTRDARVYSCSHARRRPLGLPVVRRRFSTVDGGQGQ